MKRLNIILRSVAVVLLLAASAAGCYRHIVRTQGESATSHDIYEPNLKDEDTTTGKPKAAIRDDNKTPK